MNFFDLSDEANDAAKAQYTILSVPLEKTVSYGTGTAQGPAAQMATHHRGNVKTDPATAGRSFQQAFILMYYLAQTCQAQVDE